MLKLRTNDMSEMKNINTLWTSLNRIYSHFTNDVEQIKNTLSNQIPGNYEQNAEIIRLLPKFKALLETAKDQDSNEKLIFSENNETIEFSYKDLKYIVDEMIRTDQKRNRNENLLNVMCFNHIVALFDAALIDIIKVVFQYYPHFSLPLQKGAEMPTLSYMDVFNANSVNDLKQKYIEKRLFLIGMKGIHDQIKFLRSFLKFDCHLDHKKNVIIKNVDDAYIISLIEIRETRNLHVHNNGIINKNYLNKINDFLYEINSKEKDSLKHIYCNYISGEGTFRNVAQDYIIDSSIKLQHLLTQIKDAIIEKLISQSEIDRLLTENQEYFRNKYKNI